MRLRVLEYEQGEAVRALFLMDDGQLRDVQFKVQKEGLGVSTDSSIFYSDLLGAQQVHTFVSAIVAFACLAFDAPPSSMCLEQPVKSRLDNSMKLLNGQELTQALASWGYAEAQDSRGSMRLRQLEYEQDKVVKALFMMDGQMREFRLEIRGESADGVLDSGLLPIQQRNIFVVTVFSFLSAASLGQICDSDVDQWAWEYLSKNAHS